MTDFTALYRRYAPDVFRFAFYLAGSREKAEDITSETFVRAWTAREPIRSATAKGFLLTIARNVFLKQHARDTRHVGLPEDVELLLADPGPSPHARAEQRAELGAVIEGLHELSAVDRAALLLRAFEGVGYEEIARVLGIPIGTAKVRVHRARLALAARRSQRED
ncbi:MAG: RNA polymerase sigma factor [Acidobacteriota bacterium]